MIIHGNTDFSFILSGGYEERILDLKGVDPEALRSGHESADSKSFTTHQRNRWSFNYLDGERDFHRVMIKEGTDAWTIFGYTSRAKTWGMVDLDGIYHAMSTSIKDQDGAEVGGTMLATDLPLTIGYHTRNP